MTTFAYKYLSVFWSVFWLALLTFLVFLISTSCDRTDLTSGPKIGGKTQPSSDPDPSPAPDSCSNLPLPSPGELKVKINEVMIENTQTFPDENGNFSPWVEIYNTTDEELSLCGIPLSDEILNPDKWHIPNVPEAKVKPRGFMVVHLDADTSKKTGLHANFTLLPGAQLQILINKGSDIFFFDGKKLGPDQSAGRFPDGDSKVSILSEPTPGEANKEPSSSPKPTEASFVRGDANGDRRLNITDMTTILKVLFQSEPFPKCQDQLDSNDDGAINLTDALYIGGALFLHGPPPPPPYPQQGTDPTPDSLLCPNN